MTNIRFAFGLVISTAFLTACGGGGGGSSPTNVAPPVVTSAACVQSVKQAFVGNIETVSANAGGGEGGSGGDSSDGGGAAAGGGLGKVLGGKLTVTDLSDSAVIGSAITDSTDGLVTIKTCSRPGPFLLTLEGQAGATYYDEGLNQMTPFGVGNVLHALVDKWDEHVGVSPLTEAAYQYALANTQQNSSVFKLTSEQVSAANSLVLNQYNLKQTTSFKMASINTLPVSLDSNSDQLSIRSTKYGIAAASIGGLVKSANIFNPTLKNPALAITKHISLDFKDGLLDSFSGNTITVGDASTRAYDHLLFGTSLSQGNKYITDKFGNSFNRSGIDASTIVDLSGTVSYYIENPVISQDQSNNNIQSDRVILNDNGSVDIYRSKGGSTTLIPNFLTNVKKIIHTSGMVDSNFEKSVAKFYALKRDGSLWVWGGANYCASETGLTFDKTYNFSNSNTFSISQPIELLKSIPISDIAINGGEVAIASANDGRVFVWGLNIVNGYTRISDLVKKYTSSNGDSIADVGLNINTPCVKIGTQITSQINVVAVNATWNSFTALHGDGTVQSMGQNSFYIDGPLVKGGGFVAVGSYGSFSTGIKKDGSLVRWGDYYGGPAFITVSSYANKLTNITEKDIAELKVLYIRPYIIGTLKTSILLTYDGRAFCTREDTGSLGTFGMSLISKDFVTRRVFNYGSSGILLTDTGRLFKIDCNLNPNVVPSLLDSPIDVTDAIRSGSL